MLPDWREEAISKAHDRKQFDCGDPRMNDFLVRHARQSHEQNASKTFCAIDSTVPDRILGFYTIAPSAISYDRVPPATTRGLARHEVAGFKLARIATDRNVAGHGLGGGLLSAAALRCLRLASSGGGILMLIDAKNDRAAGWYASYGAEPVGGRPLTLVLPLATFVPGLKAQGLL